VAGAIISTDGDVMKGVAKMKDKSIQVLKLMAEGHTLDEAVVSDERVVIDDFS